MRALEPRERLSVKGVNGKEPGFDVMREQRLSLILSMAVSGASYRAISAHLHKLVDTGQPQRDASGEIVSVWHAPAEWKINHVQVGNEVKEALKASRKENKQAAAELREMRGLRLRQLLLGVWPKAVQGDVGAGWLALAIDDKLAKNDDIEKGEAPKPQRVIFSIEDNGSAPSSDKATGPASQPTED